MIPTIYPQSYPQLVNLAVRSITPETRKVANNRYLFYLTSIINEGLTEFTVTLFVLLT